MREEFAPSGWRARFRASVVTILACAFVVSPVAHVVAAQGLPAAADLAADAAAVRTKKVPVVLFFNRFDCPFCERALRQFLLPMSRDPAVAAKAIFRQVEIDKAEPLVDFDGRKTTHKDFAARYNIRYTPTIWFVDGEGKPLVEAIVGLRTVDFYGWYLEQAIADSQARLEGRMLPYVPPPVTSASSPVQGTPVR